MPKRPIVTMCYWVGLVAAAVLKLEVAAAVLKLEVAAVGPETQGSATWQVPRTSPLETALPLAHPLSACTWPHVQVRVGLCTGAPESRTGGGALTVVHPSVRVRFRLRHHRPAGGRVCPVLLGEICDGCSRFDQFPCWQISPRDEPTVLMKTVQLIRAVV